MSDNIISGQANQSQIDALNLMRMQAEQSTESPIYNTSSNSRTYFVAFDGTWNNRDNTVFGPESNVSLLEKQAQHWVESNGGKSNYYKGVGTQDFAVLSWADAATGLSTHSTARQATAEFQAWAQKEFEANPNVKIELAGTSFSRGGITHAAFLNNVYDEGVGKRGSEIYKINDNGDRVMTGYSEHWIKPQSPDLGKHFMMDRVAGDINLIGKSGTVLPAAANLSVVHIRAQDEHRREFASESIRNPDGSIDKRFKEIDICGAHSNIGGPYKNNGIGDYVLDAGLKAFKSAGLDLGQAPLGHRIGDEPLNIHNSYAKWTNSAHGLGEPGAPGWTERKDNTNYRLQPAPAGAELTPAIKPPPALSNMSAAEEKPTHTRPAGGYPVPDWSDLSKPIREYNQEDGTSKLYTFNSDGVLLREQNLDAKGNDMNPTVAVDRSQQFNVAQQQPSGPKLELSFG